MRLKFIRKYKSIEQFDDIEINDFSVITGINGAGKTHLLNAIEEGSVKIEGIDSSEIILYNYNDFNIFNEDIKKNATANTKYENLQNKRQKFFQKINNNRTHILSSFVINPIIENIFISNTIFEDHFILQNILNWSENDSLLYRSVSKELQEEYSLNNFINLIKPNHQDLFLHIFNYINNSNIRITDIGVFIENLRIFYFKFYAFIIFKTSSFSIKSMELIKNELNDFIAKKIDFSSIDIHDEEFRKNYSEKFLSILELIQMLSLNSNIIFEFPELIFKHIPELIDEIKSFYIKHIDSDLLKQIIAINGEDKIIEPIMADHGFFDLKEIEQAEKQYQTLKKQNEYHEFENTKDKSVHYLTEEEFTNHHGESPVNILNKVLEQYDCNGYEFKQTELHFQWGRDINQQKISINLYNKTGNYSTTLDSLSSGERTLLALAFSIYKLKRNKIIAKVFLMDEIDSALHPSMSKRLLNVLYNLFYKELGIKIIISTHSPSTVAFSPDNSLLLMKRVHVPRLIKTNKDSALRELTLGVPSFSINYENRRQVFVESKYDVEYYEGLYNIFKKDLDPDISLNFIASGDVNKDKNNQPNSSCDKVIEITKILRNAGNNTIWGIIDWDKRKNIPKVEHVKVLGFNKRYSMENFILDPLLMAILLIREKKYKPEYFGLPANFKLHDLLAANTDVYQTLIDKITFEINQRINQDSNDKIDYTTVGNIPLKIPSFIRDIQGHELEKKYNETFPCLGEIFRGNDNVLKKAVINKVVEDYPHLAPRELFDVLKEVQEI